MAQQVAPYEASGRTRLQAQHIARAFVLVCDVMAEQGGSGAGPRPPVAQGVRGAKPMMATKGRPRRSTRPVRNGHTEVPWRS